MCHRILVPIIVFIICFGGAAIGQSALPQPDLGPAKSPLPVDPTAAPRLTSVTPNPSGRIVGEDGLHRIDLEIDIPAIVPLSAFRVWGVASGEIGIAEFSYDQVSGLISLTLDTPIRSDIVTVVLDYTITSLQRVSLDGELSNPRSIRLPSGDGIPGGKAVFRYEVLQGDANRDGATNLDDILLVISLLGQTSGDPGFDPQVDLSGDGVINDFDIFVAVNGQGRNLPSVSSPPPTIEQITPDPTAFVTADFSEIVVTLNAPVDPDHLDPSDLFVATPDLQIQKASSISVGPDGRALQFGFRNSLSSCGRYSVNLSPSIADLSGALLAIPVNPPVINGLRPPTAPIFDPFPSVVNNEIVTLTGTVQGAAEVRVVGPELIYVVPVTDGMFTADVELPTDFVHSITANGISDCGVSGLFSTIQVTRDTSPPTVQIDFPTNGQQITTGTVTVAGRVSDEFSGLDELTVTVNGMPASIGTGPGGQGTFLRMNVGLTFGVQDITVVATDGLGNSRIAVIQVNRIEIPPGTPTIVTLGGDGQSAPVLTELLDPIEVLLRGPTGNPLVGKVVTFTVERNNGRLASAAGATGTGSVRLQVLTDSMGIARAYWGLGNTAGPAANRVVASSRDLVGTVFFCADGVSASAGRIVIGDHNNQRGEVDAPLARPLTAYVTDGEGGNPISGVPVTFTVTRNDGVFDNGDFQVTVPTGSDGRARATLTLGTIPGLNTVQADFPSNQGLPATFSATGLRRLPGQPTSLTGVVQDNVGRPIGGALATLTVALDFPAGPQPVILGPVQSDIAGRFVFDKSVLPPAALNNTIPGGPAKVLVSGVFATTLDGQPIDREWAFPYVGYDVMLVEGAANTLQDPVWLPELDPANEVVYDGSQDVVLTIAGFEGLEFKVRAGSMTLEDGTRPNSANPEVIRLNAVHFDEVPMALPDGNAVPFAWTLQPKNARFDPPITVQIPNMTGETAGTIVQLLQWNNDTADFQSIGTGSVTVDQSTIESDEGSGIRVAGWGTFTPPPPPETELHKCPEPKPNGCSAVPDVWTFIGGPNPDFLSRTVIGANCPDGTAPSDCYAVNFASIACNRHDVCYGDCDGPSKIACDLELLGRLTNACDLIDDSGARAACKAVAYSYFAGLQSPISIGFFAAARLDCLLCNLEGAISPAAEFELDDLPNSPFSDADRDGMEDLWELSVGLNPTNPLDATADFDADTLSCLMEFLVGSDPFDSRSLNPQLLDSEVVWATQPEPPLVLDEDWAVRVGGRTVQAGPTGAFSLSVPYSDRFVRIRATGQKRSQQLFWASGPILLQPDSLITIDTTQGSFSDTPLPEPLRLIVNATALTVGQTLPITVIGEMSDGNQIDLATRESGTTYASSSPSVVVVDQDGFATGVSRGSAFITVNNDGATAIRRIDVGDSLISTEVVGLVLLEDGSPAIGAQVTVLPFGHTSSTNEHGLFSITSAFPDGATTIGIMAELDGDEGSANGIEVIPQGLTDAGIVTLSSRQTGPLYPVPMIDVGNFPADLAVADFNSDGISDLATANRLSNTVTVRLGIGDGAFAPAQSFGVGSFPGAVAVGDLDGDLNLDIAASVQGAVSILLGNGDGTFDSRPDVAVGYQISDIETDDLNGDGLSDVVTANFTYNSFSVLLSNGNGTFQPRKDFDAGLVVSAVAIGDFDVDGSPDIGTANNSAGTVSVFRGHGDGTFGERNDFEVGAGPASLLFGDFDGNGSVDLATANSSADSITVLFGIGGGKFGDRKDYEVGFQPFSLACSDFDEDGIRDLAVSSQSVGFGLGIVSVFLGDGDGTFLPRQDFPVGGSPEALDFGDFDSDGIIDLVSINVPSWTAAVLFGIGDGTFRVRTDYSTGSNPSDVVIEDVNGDLVSDLVIANSKSGDVSVLLGNGDGTFSNRREFAVGSFPLSLSSGDINNDGSADLVTANYGSDCISILLNDGNAVFSKPISLPVGFQPRAVAIGDVDENGNLDVVVARGGVSGFATVMLGNGNGTFSSQFDVVVGGVPSGIVIVDVNDDLNADLVVASTLAGSVSILLGNGDGTFGPREDFAAVSQPGSVAVADLDLDGNNDIVVSSGTSNFIAVLIGDGAGRFDVRQEYDIGTRTSFIAVGDADNDGILDVFATSSGGNFVSLSLGNGDGTLRASQKFATSDSPQSLAIADLDGSVGLDIVTVSSRSLLSVLLNQDGLVDSTQRALLGGVATSRIGTHADEIAIARSAGDSLNEFHSGYASNRGMMDRRRLGEKLRSDSFEQSAASRTDTTDTKLHGGRIHPGGELRKYVVAVIDLEIVKPELADSWGADDYGFVQVNQLQNSVGQKADINIDYKYGVPRGVIVDGPTTTSMGTLGGPTSLPTGWLGDELLIGQADLPDGSPRLVLWTAADGLLDLNQAAQATYPSWNPVLTKVRGVLDNGSLLAEAVGEQGELLLVRLDMRVFERDDADLNADAVVDQWDLRVIVDLVRTGGSAGDLNHDSRVDSEDIAFVLRRTDQRAREVFPIRQKDDR